MKYYIYITLLPDAEASLGFLWQKVYQQLHIALADNKVDKNESAISIAFPKYRDNEFPLGDKVRLFANQQEQLKQLNVEKWLIRFMDYTHIKPIKEVPLTVKQFARFKRKQFKSNFIKEAKRRAMYTGESLEVAQEHFKHYQTETSLPFINMISLSMNGDITLNRKFKLFITRELFEKAQLGVFDCYGLSKTATVPWF